MGISYHTEPHILAGSVSPTIGRRNITLPTDNGLNSIEWRLRKELAKGKVTVFGRKLRVGTCSKILITVIMHISHFCAHCKQSCARILLDLINQLISNQIISPNGVVFMSNICAICRHMGAIYCQ